MEGFTIITETIIIYHRNLKMGQIYGRIYESLKQSKTH